jgi:hypothetical protein
MSSMNPSTSDANVHTPIISSLENNLFCSSLRFVFCTCFWSLGCKTFSRQGLTSEQTSFLYESLDDTISFHAVLLIETWPLEHGQYVNEIFGFRVVTV